MLLLKSRYLDLAILATFLILVLGLGACTTPFGSGTANLIPTATRQASVPAITSGEVATMPSTSKEDDSDSTTPIAAPAAPDTRPTHTVQPEPLAGYIPNPYMGWQDTQPINKRFTETVGYGRVNWDDVNPNEGVYDWSPIESVRADLAEADDTFSFRVRPAQPPPWGDGHQMPAWLVERGARIAETSSDILEGVISTEPLYSDCLFLEAHATFVDALRRRYDGDPQVAFIDIGSYGNYGEWGSEQYDDEPDSLDWHARRRIIDMYLGGQGTRPCQEADGQIKQVSYEYTGFQRTQLIMPYTPWFPDSLEYALSQRPDVGIRHDALGSESHQRRYREEIGHLVQQRWPQAPIIFEYYPEAYTPEALRRARDFAQEMHASFVHENFDGRGQNDLIEELLETIGYRLVLREMTYTSELGPGETLRLDMTWENTGSAPPYFENYPLVVSLTNALGVTAYEQPISVDIRTWLPGQPIQLSGELQLPANFPAGTYDLRLAFVDPARNQAALTLAIDGQDAQGRYLIGPVNILP